MYDRTKLVKLLEECINDAKNLTIYRDLQPAIITCLFNSRLNETKAVAPEVVPEPVVEPVIEKPIEAPKVEETVPEVPKEEEVVPETPVVEETPKEEKTDEEKTG